MDTRLRPAILVVRVWFEGDPPNEFRARLLEVSEAPSSEQVVATVATTEDFHASVRSWLEDVLAR